MAFPKVTCWNSAGIRAGANSTPKKIVFFDKEFPQANFAIAAFLETHHKNDEDIPDYFHSLQNTQHIIHTPTHTQMKHMQALQYF